MTGVDAAAQTATGFAGLTALATALPPEPVFAEGRPMPPTGEATPAATSNARTVETPTFWTAGRRWAAVAAGILAVIGLANLPKDGGSQRAPTPPAFHSPPASYEQASPYAPPAPAQDQSFEAKPSIGTGQILSKNEIRYCLSEKARMEAMGDFIDSTKRLHVERFNALVGDYNARCSDYRYRKADMASASATVAAIGSQLRSQAAAMVGQWR